MASYKNVMRSCPHTGFPAFCRILPLLALLGFAIDTAAYAPPTTARPTPKKEQTDPASEFNAFVERNMKENRIVGLSIAVLDDQNIAFAKGFGYADKAAGRIATANTIYRAGSISKVFTATAIMQLAESRRIDIDAPLQNALPNFSIRSRGKKPQAITPRMIMTHHAGLPSDYFEGGWGENPERFTTVVDALHDEYRTFAPNQILAYSNLGFSILGAAVEQASDTTFENYMQTHLLAPLGMNESVFTSQIPPLTQAYGADGEPAYEPRDRDIPAGGLNTSAAELVKFGQLWFDGIEQEKRILNSESIAEMQRRQNSDVPLDGDNAIGLAWMFAPRLIDVDGPVLIHGGAMINHRAVLVVLPRQRLAVAVLSNSANAATGIFAREALSLFLKTKSGNTYAARKQTRDASRYTLAPRSEYPGSYFTDWGFISVTEKRGKLFADLGGKTMRLEPQENGYYRLKYRWLGLIPVDIGFAGRLDIAKTHTDGIDALITHDAGFISYFGKQIRPVDISSTWKARLGEYKYLGKDVLALKTSPNFKLAIEHQFLMATVQSAYGAYKIVLDPVNDSELVIQGLGRNLGGTVKFLRDSDGEFVKFSGMTFRRTSATAR